MHVKLVVVFLALLCFATLRLSWRCNLPADIEANQNSALSSRAIGSTNVLSGQVVVSDIVGGGVKPDAAYLLLSDSNCRNFCDRIDDHQVNFGLIKEPHCTRFSDERWNATRGKFNLSLTVIVSRKLLENGNLL